MVEAQYKFLIQYTIGPSYKTFYEPFGNRMYYKLVTPNTKHMVCIALTKLPLYPASFLSLTLRVLFSRESLLQRCLLRVKV